MWPYYEHNVPLYSGPLDWQNWNNPIRRNRPPCGHWNRSEAAVASGADICISHHNSQRFATHMLAHQQFVPWSRKSRRC